MTKEVDAKNQIWFEKDGKFVKLGLTRTFLQSMDECWHILPSNMEHIKEKAPLFTIETNDGIMSLLSPVTGNLYNWDTKAANFPDKLTENDTILTLTSEAVEKPADPRETLLARIAAQQGAIAAAVPVPRRAEPVRPRFNNVVMEDGVQLAPQVPQMPDWIHRIENDQERFRLQQQIQLEARLQQAQVRAQVPQMRINLRNEPEEF